MAGPPNQLKNQLKNQIGIPVGPGLMKTSKSAPSLSSLNLPRRAMTGLIGFTGTSFNNIIKQTIFDKATTDIDWTNEKNPIDIPTWIDEVTRTESFMSIPMSDVQYFSRYLMHQAQSFYQFIHHCKSTQDPSPGESNLSIPSETHKKMLTSIHDHYVVTLQLLSEARKNPRSEEAIPSNFIRNFKQIATDMRVRLDRCHLPGTLNCQGWNSEDCERE